MVQYLNLKVKYRLICPNNPQMLLDMPWIDDVLEQLRPLNGPYNTPLTHPLSSHQPFEVVPNTGPIISGSVDFTLLHRPKAKVHRAFIKMKPFPHLNDNPTR